MHKRKLHVYLLNMPREPYPPLSLQTPVVSVFEMEGVMVSHVMFGKPAFGKKKESQNKPECHRWFALQTDAHNARRYVKSSVTIINHSYFIISSGWIHFFLLK